MAIVVGSAALFGMLGPLSRFAYDAGHGAAGVRRPGARSSGCSGTAVFVAWRARRGDISLTRWATLPARARRTLLLAATMGFTLNLAMFIAFDRITVALALLGFYTYPAIVAVANTVLGRDRLDRRRVVALVLALAGMVAVVASQLDPAAGIRFDALGFGLALGAALSQTVFIVISRDGYPTVPTEQAMAVILGSRSSARRLVSIVSGHAAALVEPVRSPSLLPLLLFTGIFAAAIPSIGFLTGIRAIGGTRAGILMLFEPVVGVALAAWLLGESLVPLQVVGALAILAAAVILQRGAGDRGRQRTPMRWPTMAVRSWSRAGPDVAERIRILLVDDHAMVRRGMRDFLALHDDLEVVGEAADGAEALAAVEALHPDVVSWTC